MKRTTTLIFSFLLAFLPFFSIKGQTLQEVVEIVKNYNLTEINQLSVDLAKRSLSEKEEAISFAKAKGLPISFTTEDGGFAEIQRILPNGTPIYYRTFNKDAARSTRTNHLNSGGSTGFNLDGENMKAYVWDGGHPLTTHQEYKDSNGNTRVFISDAANPSLHSHAAHVVGTITAKGVQPQAKGMAPKSKVFAYEWNMDVSEATLAAASGMLISNHSYGYDSSTLNNLTDAWIFGAYDTNARSWDQLLSSAEYYLMVVAAGNDGSRTNFNKSPLVMGYDMLTGHATSKNNLVVANANDALVDNAGNLISVTLQTTSSPGPTDDLRIKPDITGNGADVYSTFASGNSTYGISSGTSMASPNISGTLLLLQEHAQKTSGNYLKAASLKGLALHTADDAGPPGPDAKWGWGLLNAKRAAEAISANGTNAILSETTLNQGQTITMEVTSDGLNMLQASISWTDKPGHAITTGPANVNTPVLINDLDIRISKDGVTYYPWKLTSATTNSQTSDNSVDPYERIDILNATGTYTITISHKGNLSGGSQNFTLIVTGIVPNCEVAEIPQNIVVDNITHAEARISWTGDESFFDIRYRPVGESVWIDNSSIIGNTLELSDLMSDLTYEAQIRSKCSAGVVSEYGAIFNFSTLPQPDNLDCNQGTESSDSYQGINIKDNLVANDFIVTAGSALEIKTIEVNVFVPSNASPEIPKFNVAVYNDFGNKPGGSPFISLNNITPTHGEFLEQFSSHTLYRIFIPVDIIVHGGMNGSTYWLQLTDPVNQSLMEISSVLYGSPYHVWDGSDWVPEIGNFDGVWKLRCETIPPPCPFNISGNVEPITRVQFAGIDNSSSATIDGSPALENFTHLVGEVHPGEQLPITLKGNTDGNYVNYFTVWVDWNQDGIWGEDERYELGYIINSTGLDSKSIQSMITVPTNAKSGSTLMRIIKSYGESPLNPCAIYSYGQAEDYTIHVSEDPGFVYENGSWIPANPNGISTSSDNITIINGTAVFNTDISAKNIVIHPNATLEVENVLRLYGNLNIDGNLVFKSNSTRNGELAYLRSSSQINGEATVERYFQSIRSYRMVSSSVTTSTSIHTNWQEGATGNDDNPFPGYGTHITGTTIDQTNGFDATQTGNPSMWTVDLVAQQFVPISNTDVNTLSAGESFLMYIRGDRSMDLNSNSSSGSTTLRAKGSLHKGNYSETFSTSTAGQFVMFGNPYQSSVDINRVFSESTNVSPGYYFVYDPSQGNYGGYVSVLLPSGTNVLNSTANQYLQPGQAAQFATSTNGPATIKFTENTKTPGHHNNTNSINEISEDYLTVKLYKTSAYLEGKTPHDGLGIFFGNQFDNRVTSEDVPKPLNFKENLSLERDDILLSAEFRSLPETDEVHQLNISGYTTENYTFSFGMEGLENTEFYLVDTYTGSLTEIENLTTYDFVVDQNISESKASDRFFIQQQHVLGNPDHETAAQIKLFPNPVNEGNIFISAPGYSGIDIEIEILDILGHTLYSSTKSTIDGLISIPLVEAISSGVYQIVITTPNDKTVFRLIRK